MAYCLVRSGQHYDYSMSAKFFDNLKLPSPDFNLKTNIRTPVAQTAEVMTGFERIIGDVGPGLIISVGNTAIDACIQHVTMTAKK